MKSFLVAITVVMLFGTTSFARDCVWKRDIRDFFPVDNDTIELWTIAGNVDVHVKRCSNLLFAQNIGFRTFPRNSWEVCEGDDLLVLDPNGRTILDRCEIDDID